MFTLSSIEIKGLNDRRDLFIPIQDNRLVLLGENGQGKSTVTILLYSFLTCQWRRMLQYNFEEIAIALNNREFRLARTEIQSYCTFESEIAVNRGGARNYYVRRIMAEEGTSFLNHLRDTSYLRSLIERLGLPRAAMAELERWAAASDSEGIQKIPSFSEDIKAIVKDTILFLPTFRRIEQDLETILPNAARRMQEIEAYAETETGSIADGSFRHIEFARFGMTDVEHLIAQRIQTLSESARTRLNNLTGEYLREIINERHQDLERTSLNALTGEQIEKALRRIDNTVLSDADKTALTRRISQLRAKKRLTSYDKAVLKFVTKLTLLSSQRDAEEEAIRGFVRVCGNYLTEKAVVFDDVALNLNVRPVRGDVVQADWQIQWKQLSSGEKQVVALFAHIYLSEQSSLFIIIDEPELSLSVKWQSTFLPDILESKKCSGLIAVTHSPFIFNNSLDRYARSIDELSQLRA
jgi:hypothetical protein